MQLMNARSVCLFMLAMGLATLVGAADGLEGRWKLAGDGTCYLDRTDSGPDQCSAMPGRWKLGGDGSCHWDDDDSGPNQCDPAEAPPSDETGDDAALTTEFDGSSGRAVDGIANATIGRAWQTSHTKPIG
jgi:hypothetical protein